VDAELRVHFDEPRYVVGHDFQGDDFSPIFFSGLSNHLFTAFCNRTNQHAAPIPGRPHAMIFARIHHIIVRFGTLLIQAKSVLLRKIRLISPAALQGRALRRLFGKEAQLLGLVQSHCRLRQQVGQRLNLRADSSIGVDGLSQNRAPTEPD